MSKEPLAVISSFVGPTFLRDSHDETVTTPWGTTQVTTGNVEGQPVVVLLRYDRDIVRPSHRINYRANLWAMRQMGIKRILSQNAIGSVNPVLRPGDVVVPHDFLDRTKGGRPLTFFDADDLWVRVDMTEPFCPEVRVALIRAAREIVGRVVDRAVFACTDGPRFETPAEIRALARDGADIVGTPLVPEVVLAREAEMCFASLAAIINYGSGLAPAVIHTGGDSMEDFYYGSSGLHERLEAILRAAILGLASQPRHCACGAALRHAFKGKRPEWLDHCSLDDANRI